MFYEPRIYCFVNTEIKHKAKDKVDDCLMDENYISFERGKINTDASRLVVLFWNYRGAENPWHPI